MDFRTIVKIAQADFAIEPFEQMLFVGSCFADSIGKRFQEERFRVTVNPFGVMYNPVSILHTIERVGDGQTRWRVAVLTLGTNHVYVEKATGEVVDNCGKRPAHLFEERELTVGECVENLSRAIDILRERDGVEKVIVTVSPIRYAKYGFHGSQLSKAVLLLATDELTRKYPDVVTYFPAYEIVNDELRDYRFYAPDMLHPSEQAVEYVWERLSNTYFSAKTRHFIEEYRPVKAALAHRPFHPESAEYQQFLAQTNEKLEVLMRKYRE